MPLQRQTYFSVSSEGVPIRNIADYSPFGVQLDGRSVTMDSYRYGFQNQEKDDELKGAGNSVNYKYRMHDPRVGRFFAVDPLKSTYPWYSTYQFSGNRPIDCVEIEGAEPKSVINSDGSLTKTAIKVLHALTGVEISLLQNVKVMNQNDNPINAPWFNRSNGGGGLTVGSTIYLTDNYFSTDGYSNKKGNTNYGSETGRSVFFWIKILSHEVGHLPQAESFGNDLIGKVSYFVNFSFGYLSGISKLNKKAHDTFSDEVTAELGSYVFDRLFFDDYPIKKDSKTNKLGKEFFEAFNENDNIKVESILNENKLKIQDEKLNYKTENSNDFDKVGKKLSKAEAFKSIRNLKEIVKNITNPK